MHPPRERLARGDLYSHTTSLARRGRSPGSTGRGCRFRRSYLLTRPSSDGLGDRAMESFRSDSLASNPTSGVVHSGSSPYASCTMPTSTASASRSSPPTPLMSSRKNGFLRPVSRSYGVPLLPVRKQGEHRPHACAQGRTKRAMRRVGRSPPTPTIIRTTAMPRPSAELRAKIAHSVVRLITPTC